MIIALLNSKMQKIFIHLLYGFYDFHLINIQNKKNDILNRNPSCKQTQSNFYGLNSNKLNPLFIDINNYESDYCNLRLRFYF